MIKLFQIRYIASLIFVIMLSGCFDRESKQESIKPYPVNVNYEKEINHALSQLNDDRRLMLIYGANWCPTCRKVDASLSHNSINNYLRNKFTIIKVNIGNFDKNIDIARRFKMPIMKGIPAMSIINKDGSVYKNITTATLSVQHKKGRKSFYKFIRNL